MLCAGKICEMRCDHKSCLGLGGLWPRMLLHKGVADKDLDKD